GLERKGHLGPGADADITLYNPSDNPAEMFALPRLVIKGGEVLVDDGEIRTAVVGRTIHTERPYDHDALADLPEWFAGRYSIEYENFSIGEEELAQGAIEAATE